MGATDYKAVFSGFGVSVVFYVIAIFALPALLLKTQWGVRLVAKLFKLTGESSCLLYTSRSRRCPTGTRYRSWACPGTGP